MLLKEVPDLGRSRAAPQQVARDNHVVHGLGLLERLRNRAQPGQVAVDVGKQRDAHRGQAKKAAMGETRWPWPGRSSCTRPVASSKSNSWRTLAPDAAGGFYYSLQLAPLVFF